MRELGGMPVKAILRSVKKSVMLHCKQDGKSGERGKEQSL